MPRYADEDRHKEEEFIALAPRCGIEDIIDNYRQLGLVFCYYDGSDKGGTFYNRTPEVIGQGFKEGIVYISSNELETCGLTKEEGFTMLTLHEIGHYEGFRRGLDGGHQQVAWRMAEELARTIYEDALPDWWTRVRREEQERDRVFYEKVMRIHGLIGALGAR